MMSDSVGEDKGLSRVTEIKGIVSIFISLFDEMRKRKFDKFESLDIAQEFMFGAMGYKANVDAIDEGPTETFIQFIPAGEDGHGPDCPNHPHNH